MCSDKINLGDDALKIWKCLRVYVSRIAVSVADSQNFTGFAGSQCEHATGLVFLSLWSASDTVPIVAEAAGSIVA